MVTPWREAQPIAGVLAKMPLRRFPCEGSLASGATLATTIPTKARIQQGSIEFPPAAIEACPNDGGSPDRPSIASAPLFYVVSGDGSQLLTPKNDYARVPSLQAFTVRDVRGCRCTTHLFDNRDSL